MSEETEDFVISDMDDTLGDAFDAAEDEGPARDESGRFTSDNEEAPEAAASEEDTDDGLETEDDAETAPDAETSEDGDAEDTDEGEETLEPPSSWTSEAKNMFSEASPELQAYILQRDAESQEGYAKAKEQFESKAAIADEFTEIVRPYEAQMRAEGATPTQAVQSLLNTAQILRTGSPQQKEAIIRQTAQQFGVNLSGTEPGELDEFTDPNVAALQQQVADLTNFITQQQQTSRSEQERGIVSEITRFAEETDDKGELLRPHYNAVQGDLIPLIASIRQQSPGKSNAEVLNDAYDRAVYANPETRKLVLEREAQAAKEKSLAERKKAATDAKKTKNIKSGGVRPGGGAKPSSKPSDWDDELSEVYDKVS